MSQSTRTSWTDIPEYREFCELAATDPDTFAAFRRQPEYHHIVYVSPEDGQRYLERLTCVPSAALDATGLPPIYPYETAAGTLMLDPVMIRYCHDRQEIWNHHGETDGMRILEIGGGFGGLARLLAAHCASYAICDLPEVRHLQDVYLARYGVSVEDADPTEAYDLVVSTFAFSELYAEVQAEYADDYLRPTPRGWMICNFVNPAHDPDDVIALVPGARYEPEEPRTHPANRVMVWG